MDWDDLFAEFSYCLGQSFEYIENNITIMQIVAYRKYWKKNPPVHLLVAAYLGYKNEEVMSGEQLIRDKKGLPNG